jgi:hypothetical protein
MLGVVKVSFCLHKKSPIFLENKGNFGLLPAGDERIERHGILRISLKISVFTALS